MIMILVGMLFLSSIQPMMMIMMVIVVTFVYSLYFYVNMMTFWYSVVMMMIVLSGVMVVFTYMASVVPNEKFDVSLVVVFLFLGLPGYVMFGNLWDQNDSFWSISMWDGSVMMFNMYMISFLLVIMMGVVWISDWSMGAVRG